MQRLSAELNFRNFLILMCCPWHKRNFHWETFVVFEVTTLMLLQSLNNRANRNDFFCPKDFFFGFHSPQNILQHGLTVLYFRVQIYTHNLTFFFLNQYSATAQHFKYQKNLVSLQLQMLEICDKVNFHQLLHELDAAVLNKQLRKRKGGVICFLIHLSIILGIGFCPAS